MTRARGKKRWNRLKFKNTKRKTTLKLNFESYIYHALCRAFFSLIQDSWEVNGLHIMYFVEPILKSITILQSSMPPRFTYCTIQKSAE